MKKFLFTLLAGALLVSCSKNEPGSAPSSVSELGEEQFNYAATTPEIGSLGRTLFYDKGLSLSGTVSCGSCHRQNNAFADNKPFSTGFDGELTTRNSPPIQNLGGAFNIDIFGGTGQALFWDGRSRNLSDMVFEPVTNHIEMGLGSPNDLLERVESKGYYKELFTNAYGNDEVTIAKVSDALSGFVASITSHGSPFEQSIGVFGGFQGQLDPQVEEGFQLFVDKYQCMGCHNVFSSFGYAESFGEEFVNIGLDDEYADKGRSGITNNSQDDGKFKIPNLRNVALTAPYMHDGRFASLDEVLDHYSHGVRANPNLDDRLKDLSGQPKVQNITDEEKALLIKFLEALTDPTLLTNPAFSDPFSE